MFEKKSRHSIAGKPADMNERVSELLHEADRKAHEASGRARHPTRKTRTTQGETPFDCIAEAMLAQTNAIRLMAGLSEVKKGEEADNA